MVGREPVLSRYLNRNSILLPDAADLTLHLEKAGTLRRVWVVGSKANFRLQVVAIDFFAQKIAIGRVEVDAADGSFGEFCVGSENRVEIFSQNGPVTCGEAKFLLNAAKLVRIGFWERFRHFLGCRCRGPGSGK